jgi:hypothetical protein
LPYTEIMKISQIFHWSLTICVEHKRYSSSASHRSLNFFWTHSGVARQFRALAMGRSAYGVIIGYSSSVLLDSLDHTIIL